MDLEFDISVEDFVAFNLYYHKTSPTLRRWRLLSWLAVPAACVFVCAVLVAQGLTYVTWPLGLFAAVYTVIYPWRHRTHLTKLLKKLLAEGQNKGLIGPRRLSITPESINGATAFGESITKWTGVEKIVVVDEYAYVHTGAMSAFIIPKRAFADDRAFQTFVETAERYRREAS